MANPVYSTTYYYPADKRGGEILDEMDGQRGISDQRNREGNDRGYFDVNLGPDDFDRLLESIDPDCWAHVGKRRDQPT